MKKKFLLLFLLTTLLCGCSYDEYKMPKKAYINTIDKTYEVYDSNAKLYDLIQDSNVEITSKNVSLDTKTVKKHEVTLNYKYKRRKYKYVINYNVVDTTKPMFLQFSDNITIYNQSETDFCKDINYADNYDRNVKCSVSGEINTSVNGTYNLKYALTDSSNNTLEKDFVVNVIDKPDDKKEDEEPSVSESYIDFKDVVKKYKTKNNMIGIDVSYWQQDIDFKKVKEAGCDFVIIRIGVNDDIDEDISIDSYYRKNIKKAKKAGLKVGVYVYTTAINEEMAKKHANWVVKTLNTEELDFPIAFDFENFNKFTSYKINTYDLTNAFLTFKKQVNKFGYDAMLYGSLNYLNTVWIYKDTYDVWLAHYTDQTTYEGDYVMWQMASDGKIDGITGNVDIDIYYGGKNEQGTNKR